MVRDIVAGFEGMAIDEKRSVRDDYAEMVLLKSSLDAWHVKLEATFGPATKPEGSKPQPQDTSLTEGFGGVQVGQTLYAKTDSGGTVIAMLWPWRDDQHITLKLAKIPGLQTEQKEPPAAQSVKRAGAWRKPVLIAAVAVLIIVGGAAVAFSSIMARYEKTMREMAIVPVEVAMIGDGVYEGSCTVTPVSAKVKVTISAGAIQSIELLEHSHGPGYGAEAVADRIKAAQSLDVDNVTGATGSSMVIRKAIENALRQGLVSR